MKGVHEYLPVRPGVLHEEVERQRTELSAQALVTTDAKKRKALYQKIQTQLNQRGPYFPLIQPTQVFVSTKDLRNAVFNATYAVDVTQVSPR